MVYTKTFANIDDLHLSKKANSAIVLLNSYLPDDYAKYWVTVEEMTERLISCGVNSSLQKIDVDGATQHHNKHGLLEKRLYRHKTYFRPSKYQQGSPNDQRIDGKFPMPKTRLFQQRKFQLDPDARQAFCDLNKELERVDKLKRGIDRGEIHLMHDVGTQTNLSVKCSADDTILIQTTRLLEEEANVRMQEPPPPHVTPPKQKAATASNKERKNGKKKEEPADYSDGYGLFQIKSLNSVIEEMTYHAATCGNAIEHVNTDFKMGAGITTMWKCACNKTFRHDNCKWTKSGIVEEGRQFERPSPEVNVRIVKAAREVGINLEKVVEFLAGLGVKTSDYRNILHQERKVRQAIEGLSEQRMIENMREHNVAARAVPNYVGDIQFTDEGGSSHSIAQGAGSIDGAGLTRAYMHRIKGSQAVLIVFSSLTHKPIMFVHTQVKCILCTRAYNKANRGRTQVTYLDDIKVMQHKGKCYRNSKYGPAVAEEYTCVEAGRRLLIDENGVIRPDTDAVFLCKVTTDNDTRGVLNFITAQNKVIGQDADGKGEHIPDNGHSLKDCSNSLYEIRSKDKSY
uniref:Mutator-like transposase domain-containing protein n=1 Tax=Skeletonema marinoi TaxID=267567 RepID=A0A7S2M0G8_9STRA|mmetsp:Transcript_33233/g.56339  ORF Transcript_33233/g.56339 Transcript_33233/m.56339 type:complete len:569 (+) Transcript_33233:436-2142(+)